MTLEEIITEIKSDTATTPIMIAIEGYGGSGKSTIAEKLKQALGDAQIINIDDFYKPKEERVKVTETTLFN